MFCLGYHVGLGLEYKLAGNTALVGGVRWTSGLIDVTDNDRANVKINALSIHLGVLF
jgi:opacity protein-like surface antigen